ncbi:MAG: hypothetical protein WA653_00385 [Candidatus Sulfotelmatobacter sp.]
MPTASQQIAAAVLPLPEVMRGHATILGNAPDLSLVTLRQGSNGMVCTASRPGNAEFDVRCYHESFMPVVRRVRDLHSHQCTNSESLHLASSSSPFCHVSPLSESNPARSHCQTR